jgi:segregation and condensation protein B
MDDTQAKRIIEALLFVFNEPLTLKRIGEVLPGTEPAKIRALIQTLNGEYETSQRAFRIQEAAGGYQIVTDQELAPWVKKALQSPKIDSVSVAALETLAIIAYRQPITKAEVEAIRGVDVSASLDTLVERRFVRIAGRKDSPGRPFLYGTTAEFLHHFGLKSIEALPRMQLPAIAEQTEAPDVQPAAEPAAPEPAETPAPQESEAPQTEPASTTGVDGQ